MPLRLIEERKSGGFAISPTNTKQVWPPEPVGQVARIVLVNVFRGKIRLQLVIQL